MRTFARRDLLKGTIGGVAAAAMGPSLGGADQTQKRARERERVPHKNSAGRLFPIDLPSNEWEGFAAEGFSEPVCGVIYRSFRPPTKGMPLGGIDTGFIDIEADGTLGYCTVFNSYVPRRTLNLPFLGVNLLGQTFSPESRQTWLLARPREDVRSGKLLMQNALNTGLFPASDIYYWGHYPVADLEYNLCSYPAEEQIMTVGVRAWAPFLPGDVETSLLPGAVFEVHLRNLKESALLGTIALSFPGPSRDEAGGVERFSRELVKGTFSGVHVTNGQEVGFALGLAGEENVRIGGGLGLSGDAWAGIAERLPEGKSNDPGACAAVDFSLAPHETRTVRFVLGWSSPRWRGGGAPAEGGNTYTHMYSTRCGSALEAARLLVDRHDSILRRILAWQQAIYTYESLPVWLRESLVNILHLITLDGLWAVANPPLGDWCRKEDGLFGMMEDPRSCPQMECIPVSWYGNIPLVYFFPRLALSTLRGYKAYQRSDGRIRIMFGDNTEMVTDSPDYTVHPADTNSHYVDLVDRYWLRNGDDELLKEFYPSVKRATLFIMNLDTGPDGVISAGIGKELEAFENCKWAGLTPHVGGIHLAHLRMAQRMAEKVGDSDFAERCRKWLIQGSDSLESKLWEGHYYSSYYDPKSGERSDLIFASQLEGEWMARFHDLPGVFRIDRVKTTLGTIQRANVALTKYGAVNFASSDGKPAGNVGYGAYGMFPAALLTLAITYMYAGEVDLGMELARRHWRNLVCDQGYTWDQPNLLRGDTDSGEVRYGHDYYMNMQLWALPAAMEGKDLRLALAPGGLVDRVIRAARGTTSSHEIGIPVPARKGS